MKANLFAALGIDEQMAEALKQQGYTEPTPIQKEAIPVVLTGADIIAQAQTGTGKTLAFVLPILEKIDLKKEYTQALIVTPTRELAIQIAGEVQKWAPIKGVRVLAAYGGQDVERQLNKLEGTVHMIIATPGRLLDHLRRGTVQLQRLSTLVLDEADQMLHMGFLKEVEEIIIQTSPKRQTLLFSATMPGPIRNLAKSYMKTPEEIKVKTKQITLTEIEQIAIKTTERGKQEALIHLLEEYRPFLAMIFCRTKLRASKLNEALQEAGYVADELHGDLTQGKREQVMKRFRDTKIQFLVATDIAARGLDVEGITHVFNYDMPHDVESYIHRIGRTGRAGQRGMAVTMVTPRDQGTLAEIERGINAELPRRTVMADGELSEARTSGRGVSTARKAGSGDGPIDLSTRGERSFGKGRRGEARGTAAGGQRGRGATGAGRGATGAGRDSGGFGAERAERGRGAAGGRGATGAGRDSGGFGAERAERGRGAAGGRGPAGGRAATGAPRDSGSLGAERTERGNTVGGRSTTSGRHPGGAYGVERAERGRGPAGGRAATGAGRDSGGFGAERAERGRGATGGRAAQGAGRDSGTLGAERTERGNSVGGRGAAGAGRGRDAGEWTTKREALRTAKAAGSGHGERKSKTAQAAPNKRSPGTGGKPRTGRSDAGSKGRRGR